jgi:hypothetical protein
VDNVRAKLLIVTTTRSPPSTQPAEWTSSQDSARLIRDVVPGRTRGRDTLIERAT